MNQLAQIGVRLNALALPLLMAAISQSLRATEIVEVAPLTNHVILLHLDDGKVIYPNTLQVSRLVTSLADNTTTFMLSSEDDPDFEAVVNPVKTSRKSKGTEFVRDAPWGGTSFDPTSKPWASEHWIYLTFNKPLKSGKTYTLSTGALASNGSEWTFVWHQDSTRSEAIHVNTIGYAGQAPKFGYLYQWMGTGGGLDLTAYSGKRFWIYREGESLPVKEGTVRKRKSANNPETAQTKDTPGSNFLGAEVYDCDFSDVTTDGFYQLVVEDMGCSYPFKIGTDALWEAYYHAARSLYHQRSGIRLNPPYTEEGYIRPVNQNPRVTSDDGTSFAGKLLYSDYPYTGWTDGNSGGSSANAIRNAATGKTIEVAGWYHDAGDWDSYWTHHRIPILLMMAFEFAPERFADSDLNIPESGNGIPDLIDEASWLVKFNYRLRKELLSKGYSNGGVGGARVCADVFTDTDGQAESNLPSWKETRRTVVTQADAFMTYFYAGQAAHLAIILSKLGRDPRTFAVENLDHSDPAQMTHDTVNWIAEATEAFAWASDPENQPLSDQNYGNILPALRMYAATSIYRITDEESYHQVAQEELGKVKDLSSLPEDTRFGVYAYLLADNKHINKLLQSELRDLVISDAAFKGLDATAKRACRWGGVFDMPMLVGQATTPWMIENLVAWSVTGQTKYRDAIHTTADYFLGCNPLHTTWMTGVGPRPATVAFHLDSRYNHNWVPYKGMIPYGPWSMNYDYNPYKWTIDGVEVSGGHGPWNKDWANFSVQPSMAGWPGHERWNSNIHAPMSSEFTVHQNSVHAALVYGFVNSRTNSNAENEKPIAVISIDSASLGFQAPGETAWIHATTDRSDAGFGVLKWTSSDSRIAHVDAFGRVTSVTSGSCRVTCSSLDGSVSAEMPVECAWTETSVDSIAVDCDTLVLIEGQSQVLSVFFYPVEVTNRYINWTFADSGIVSVEENAIVQALVPGSTWLVATSLNSSRKDSLFIRVMEATDYIVADFDEVIPVTTHPQGNFAQLYTPGGSHDIQAANPFAYSANNSEKVVRWDRPEGDWQLIGMVLDTLQPQSLSRYAQFQFRYFGKEITDFYLQLLTTEGPVVEINETIEGEDCWKLFAWNVQSDLTLKQFNLFVNKQGNGNPVTCYFDDFKLAGKATEWMGVLQVSAPEIELASGDSALLSVDQDTVPFAWISTDTSIAVVGSGGFVKARRGGICFVKAVPLYGDATACRVVVDGGVAVQVPALTGKAWVYPNPASKYVNIVASDGIVSLEIFTLTGIKVVHYLPERSEMQVVPIENLPAGIYLVRILHAGGFVSTSRLLIE